MVFALPLSGANAQMARAATAATTMTAAPATSSGARRRSVRRVRRLEQPAALRLGGLVGDTLGAGEVGGRGGSVERRGAAAGQLEVAGRRLGELVLEIEEAAGRAISRAVP